MSNESTGGERNACLAIFILTGLLVGLLALSGCQSDPTAPAPEAPPTETVPTMTASAVSEAAAVEVAATPLAGEGSNATPTIPEVTTATEASLASLQDVLWVLVAYGDADNPVVVEEGTVVTASFSADGTVSGSASCNNYRASYEAGSEGSLSISPAATTQTVCERGMELEEGFLQALAGAQRFRFTERERLQIVYTPDDPTLTHVLTFVRGERPLVDTPWVLLSYGSPDAPTLVQEGTATSAVFLPDAADLSVGTVTGFGGCNNYHARYRVDDGQLQIDMPVSTRQSCALGMEQESAYLGALATASQYRLIGPDLEIQYAGGMLTLSATSLPLENVAWTLIALDGQPVSEGMPTLLLFEPDQTMQGGQVQGFVGCQAFAAAYERVEEFLTITSPYITGELCSEAFGLEQQFLEALAGASGYATYGEQLALTTPAGTLAFTAYRGRLTQVLWQLTGSGPIEDLQPIPEGAAFRMMFVRAADAPSGLLFGEGPCSTFTAAFTASLDEIKVNLPTTAARQAAPESCAPDLLQREQEFFLLLNEATGYRILGNHLQLLAGDEILAFAVGSTEAPQPPDTGPPAPTPGMDLSPLSGTNWYLMSISDRPVLQGTGTTAQFTVNADGNSGSVGGSAGCNFYNAPIGAGFTVGPSATSQRSCSGPPGIMEQEQAYLAALQRATGFSLTAGQLVLTTPDGFLVYSATPPQPPLDQSPQLQNRTWYLTSHGSVSAAAGVEATVRFERSGEVSGNTGCNAFSGSYQTDGPHLRMENLNSTQAACAPPVGEQERSMLAAFSSARSYRIDATLLQIFAESGTLTFSATPPVEGAALTPVIVVPASAIVGEVITFDGTQSSHSRPIIKYVWFFGDGAQAFGSVVRHAYSSAGTFVVELRLADDRAETATTTQQLRINEATATPAE